MSSDPIQAIKAKLSIEEVVTSYVPLKKAGKYLKGLCPFHQEKTPSFYVHPDKQIAYCFGCNKGGDIFEFLQAIEGLSFREALERLAERAHVELPKENHSIPRISRDQKDRLRAVCADAITFYQDQLFKTEDGKKVLLYLKNRGLEEEIIRHFQVGFAPEGKDKLYRALLELGHPKEDLLKSTVVLGKDAGAEQVVDRFQLRLLFPIHDDQGNAVAFGGRVLRKNDQPKYLNSPEYELYEKSQLLYNLHRAKKPMRELDLAIIVEGYMDVLMASQAGTPHVVAPCGTALTEEQLKLIRRSTRKLAFALDQDAAGQEALLRSIKLAQPLGFEIYVIRVPFGKDPADCVKENPELWRTAVEKRQPYLDFFLEEWSLKNDLASSEGKRHVTDAMMDLLQGAEHPVERDHALRKLSEKVLTPIENLYDYLKSLQKTERRSSSVQLKNTPALQGRFERLYEYFLTLFLAFPEVYIPQRAVFESYEVIRSAAEKSGLIQPVGRLHEEHFEEFLGRLRSSLVYKQALDYYNLRDTLDEEFYSELPNGIELKKKVFEAELRNEDQEELKQEFEKIMVLLCFESLKS